MPKLSALSPISNPADADELYIVDAETPLVSRKISFQDLKSATNLNQFVDRITNFNNANLDFVINEASVTYSYTPPAGGGTLRFLIREELLFQTNDLFYVDTKEFGGGGSSETQIRTDQFFCTSGQAEFTGSTFFCGATIANFIGASFTTDVTIGGRLTVDDIQNESGQNLDVDINQTQLNINLRPSDAPASTNQAIYRVWQYRNLGSDVLFDIVSDRHDLTSNSAARLLTDTFTCESATTFTNSVDFNDPVGVTNDSITFTQTSTSTENYIPFTTRNRYQTGVPNGRVFWQNQFYNAETSSYVNAGRVLHYMTADYSTTANSDSGIVLACGNNGGDVTTVIVDTAGNMTITGTYSPFTGVHIARFGNYERLDGFEAGRIVEVVEAIPNPDNCADVDYRIDWCKTPNTTRKKYVLYEEHVTDLDIDGLYSADDETRDAAFEQIDRARAQKIDLFKIEQIEKPGFRFEQKGTVIDRMAKPEKLQSTNFQYYTYTIIAVGEGWCWACDANGDIEAGDYLTSFENGYAQKSDAQNLDKTCFAQATGNVSFDRDFITVNINGTPRRVKRVPFEM